MLVDKHTSEEIREHIAEVPDRACEEVTIFGTPEDCIDKIGKYLKSGVTHFEFEIVSQYKESCGLLTERVIPYFAES